MQQSFISEKDYSNLAGASWPSYTDYISNNNIPKFVKNEIRLFLRSVKKFDNPAFCVLPFYGIEYPTKVACCLLSSPDDDLQKIREQMLSGIRPDNCSVCWNLEDSGFISDRILKNNLLDFTFNKDLAVIEDECRNGNYKTVHYKIDTSNSCNATCITCDSSASTSWIKLEKKIDVVKHKPWYIKKQDIDIDYVNAQSISFRGGEPLLSSVNFEILETLIESKNTDCFISFTTNGSIKLTEKQLAILSNFKTVNFNLSIDGVGPVFDYLRYPLKWETLHENLVTLGSFHFNISISYTLSNLNILYHTQTIEWFKENDLPYIINVVRHPEYFQPANLPISIKKTIEDENNTYFLNADKDTDDLSFQKFKENIVQQDKLKDISMRNYLPELYNLLNF